MTAAKDKNAPVETVGEVAAESPTGLDRTVVVDVDRDAREVVVTVGDSKARLDAVAMAELIKRANRAFAEVS